MSLNIDVTVCVYCWSNFYHLKYFISLCSLELKDHTKKFGNKSLLQVYGIHVLIMTSILQVCQTQMQTEIYQNNSVFDQNSKINTEKTVSTQHI